MNESLQAVAADPDLLTTLFPTVGRHVGRAPLEPDTDPHGFRYGGTDDAARARLVLAAAGTAAPGRLAALLDELYRHGGAAERRGVLRGLSALAEHRTDRLTGELPARGVQLCEDALRTNDPRLVAAAVGAFAGRHLPAHGWRHAVLKCLFLGVPTAAVARLDERTDDELVRMVDGFAAERLAAGREVPADARALTGTPS
jgi:hypothetical protein